MRNVILIAVVMTLAHSIFAEPYQKPTPEQRDAIYNGANTRIVFKVLDYDGGIVSNALVRTSFDMWPRENNISQGLTDEYGVFIAENKSVSEYFYRVTKDDYYDSFGTMLITPTGLKKKDWNNIRRRSAPYVTNGSWIINNPTNIVILKKIKYPVKMKNFSFSRELKTVVPAMGFDLLKSDFVKPYGKGDVVDFVLDFEGYQQSRTNYYYKLTMSFTNGIDGAYIENQYDDYSNMAYIYIANENAIYTNKLVYERFSTENEFNGDNPLMPNRSYLVLRTRSKLDANKEVVSINYSRTSRNIIFRHNYFSINGYFNTTTNSISLERKRW